MLERHVVNLSDTSKEQTSVYKLISNTKRERKIPSDYYIDCCHRRAQKTVKDRALKMSDAACKCAAGKLYSVHEREGTDHVALSLLFESTCILDMRFV